MDDQQNGIKYTEKVHDVDDVVKKLFEKSLLICQSNDVKKINQLLQILSLTNQSIDKIKL